MVERFVLIATTEKNAKTAFTAEHPYNNPSHSLLNIKTKV